MEEAIASSASMLHVHVVYATNNYFLLPTNLHLLPALYRKIVSYALLRSGLGSPTNIAVVREATGEPRNTVTVPDVKNSLSLPPFLPPSPSLFQLLCRVYFHRQSWVCSWP